jgi:hypothetical protein
MTKMAERMFGYNKQTQDRRRLFERAQGLVSDALAHLQEIESDANDFIDARDDETVDGTTVGLPEDHSARETLDLLQDWISQLENVEGELDPACLDAISE